MSVTFDTNLSSEVMMGVKASIESESESSSIGKDSDLTGGDDEEAEERKKSDDSNAEEVESPYNAMASAFEEVLPIRRGISRFYNGKSKSFASLAHASSIQDLAKSENAYTRRRRNLLSSSLIWDKNRYSASNSLLRSSGGGISKKTNSNLSRSNLAFAVAMTTSSSEAYDSNNSITREDNIESNINLLSPTFSPLQKHKPLMSSLLRVRKDNNSSTWRSFSLADLQCATTGTPTPTTPHSSFGGSTTSEESQSPFSVN